MQRLLSRNHQAAQQPRLQLWTLRSQRQPQKRPLKTRQWRLQQTTCSGPQC